ncbi:MAG: DUF460 domain-containing protein [TACK group archaeon]|nr:DUF460 domain-containing protein [TACK group archaeon]
MVGFDPGMSSGLAVLSIDGRLLLSKTYKGSRDVAMDVISVGRPIAVATDVPKVPRAVKRLASAFGCPVFRPNRYYTAYEKTELLRRNGWEGLEIHESDALFAAQLCLSVTRKKMSDVMESGLTSNELTKALLLLLSGENVKEAVKRASVNAVAFPREPGRAKGTRPPIGREKIASLENLVSELRDENDALRDEVNKLKENEQILRQQRELSLYRDRRIEMMRRRVDTLERLLADRQGENDALRRELEALRGLLRRVAEGTDVLVPKLESPHPEDEAETGSFKVVAIDDGVSDEVLDRLKRSGVEYLFIIKGDDRIAEQVAERGMFPIMPKDLSYVDMGNVVLFDARLLRDSQARSKEFWNAREIQKKREMLKMLLNGGKRLALILRNK